MIPSWLLKFMSVKLATLVLSLYFIDRVECDAWMKVTGISVVSVVFIAAKTIQNIMLQERENGVPLSPDA